jgi:hypothetical protein
MVPRFILDHYTNEFGKTPNFYAANGILVITVNGVVRAFAPQTTAQQPTRANLLEGMKMPFSDEPFHLWAKTRFGYVEGKGAFYEHMHKRSIGEFALPVI